MSTIRTRSAKGSKLTHSELDANFVRDVKIKTTTYAVLVSDNHAVIECNHASTPFTVTLGDAATMAAAETGDFEVTIANIGAAAATVARAGSDTLDGVATSVVLQQYSSVTYKVNAAGDGYNSIAGRRGITATDAELNIMDGVTASTADLNATTNFEETISATTSEVTVPTGKTVNITDDAGLKLAGTAITSTAAELNYNDISTLGTAEASKVVTSDSSNDVVGLNSLTSGTINATGDPSAGDNAAMGYTASEGLILTGQGSSYDVTIKNDADAAVARIPTGTTDIEFVGAVTVGGHVEFSSLSALTASAGSAQGGTPLTRDINEISTCGTTGDSVTLPTANFGLRIMIINNGANAADVFPASSDNLGAGVDTAASLAAGANITYAAYDTTNWVAVT